MPYHNIKLHTSNTSSMDYTKTAASMLQEIGDAMNAPCVKGVAGITLLILDTIQVWWLFSHKIDCIIMHGQLVKKNKEQCMEIVTQIHKLICAIISLSKLSDGQLTLAMSQNIALFSKLVVWCMLVY